MAAPLSIDTVQRGDGIVLTATGEIDMTNVDMFTAALSSVQIDGAVLTVDLSGVEYLDSGAINVLFANADRIELIANPILMPVLKISGLTEVTSVEPASPPAD